MVNAAKKGYRTERDIEKAYQRAGYWCHKPESRSHAGQSNQDMWNLFDIAAFHPKLNEIRFVQAKTNTASGVHLWCVRAKHFASVSGVQVDFVVKHDGRGYRMLKPFGDSYRTVFDSRSSDSNMGDDLAAFLRGEDVDA